jgi:hypothetical protein
MLDTIERTNTTAELPLDTAAKRALIESELRKDSSRSDREIARIVGCDHKTVGTARERLGIDSPLGNSAAPTPTQFRSMLIEAGKDFDAKHPQPTVEEAVDNALASGKISYATAGRGGDVDPDGREAALGRDLANSKHPHVQAAVDQCKGAVQRMREERQAEASKEDEANGEQTMVRSQREVTIQFDDSTGEWIIKQKNWPDDDDAIYINEEHVQVFLDALCDRLGIASIRRAG